MVMPTWVCVGVSVSSAFPVFGLNSAVSFPEGIAGGTPHLTVTCVHACIQVRLVDHLCVHSLSGCLSWVLVASTPRPRGSGLVLRLLQEVSPLGWVTVFP